MRESAAIEQQILTVSELNSLARVTLERHLPLCWVGGEVSNYKRYDSGHCYFTLKDDAAQVDCVLFRQKAMLLGWQPADGMQVEVRACPTLYEGRGKFQLSVEAMRRAGLGALFEAFERLKAKLGAEGLFSAARKRPLSRFPRAIGIVTSARAAALRDVLTILRRRMPGVLVILYPAPVQGEGAAARIAAAVRLADRRAECDVLIVCRGGGSIEDLWAYNDETLARAIAACGVPVISAVGHETDFTIADFVADVRAPTPSAAAQLATADRLETCEQLRQLELRLGRIVKRALEERMQRVDYLSKRLVHPGEALRNRSQQLTHLANRLCGAWERYFETLRWRAKGLTRALAAARPDLDRRERARAELARRLHESARARLERAAARLAAIDAHLTHLDPQRVLERGYSIAVASTGTIVRSAAEIAPGDRLSVKFARGSAETQVTTTSG